MPQSAISANPSALLDPARRFLRASPPTNIEWDRVGPTLADDKLPSRSPFGGLQRSFLFARHLYPSLSIFFFHGALSPREPAKRCSPACALHPGYIKGISACHLACLPVTIYHFYVDLVSCAPSTDVCHVVLATRFDRVHKYRSREGHPHLCTVASYFRLRGCTLFTARHLAFLLFCAAATGGYLSQRSCCVMHLIILLLSFVYIGRISQLL